MPKLIPRLGAALVAAICALPAMAAGQPDAQAVAAGGYAISGGFWTGATRYRIYLPLLLQGGQRDDRG